MLTAIKQIKSEVKIKDLEEMLRTQGINGAYNYIEQLNIEGVISSNIVKELDDAITESGRVSISIIPKGALTGVPFTFTTLIPSTTDYIRKYEFGLINQISSNTKEAIRNSLEADMIAGVNPRRTAVNFRDTIGLTPSQEKAVRNYRDNLENLNSRALSRGLRDKRFDPTVRRAITDKTPLSKTQIDKMTKRYRDRYLIYRSQTIARTESLRAVSMGSWLGLKEAVDSGSIERDKLKRFWRATPGKRTRAWHINIDSMNPEGVFIDEPFITERGPLMFPRDPNGTASNTINCRCSTINRLVDPATGTGSETTTKPKVKPKVKPKQKPRTPKWVDNSKKGLPPNLGQFGFKKDAIKAEYEPHIESVIAPFGVFLESAHAFRPDMSQRITDNPFGASVLVKDNVRVNPNGASGVYSPSNETIESAGMGSAGSDMKTGQWNAGKTTTSILVHEMAHAIWHETLKEVDRGVFVKLFGQIDENTLIRKVSKYGSTSAGELFAESLSIWMNPGYPKKTGLIPIEIETYFNEVFKK